MSKSHCKKCNQNFAQHQITCNIIDHVSSYIRNQIQGSQINEKCTLQSTICRACLLNLKEEKRNLETEIESLRNLPVGNENSNSQIKKKELQVKEISHQLTHNISSSQKKFIKRHQKWFYNELSGAHLRKKAKILDHLKYRGEETKSLLGEATKFILFSRYKDKRFLVKFSKDVGTRNNHGIKDIITEKIMTDIADCFMKSAKCSIVLYQDRLALCSTMFTYFGDRNVKSVVNNNEYRAIHGNEIFEYAYDKKPPDKRKKQKKFYQLEEIEKAIMKYPSYYKLNTNIGIKLLSDFRLMLLIDAFLGNQDRHHENWCLVIKTSKKDSSKKTLYFSPLFDTGRGLFWNSNVYELILKYGNVDNFQRYIDKSEPLFHLSSKEENTNHFDVVKYIRTKDPQLFESFTQELRRFSVDNFFRSCNNLISPIRIVRMKKLLKCRKAKILGGL